MRVDKKLNLVIPVFGDETEGGSAPIVAYVHATPLPAEIIEQQFLVLAQTFSAIFSRGLGVVAGPGTAMRMLRKVAQETNAWDGPNGARQIVDEVRRATTVAVPAASGGWEGVPLQVAVDRHFLTDEDQAEVENAIVFFICVSATLARAQRGPILAAAADLWGAHVSSSSFTEFLSSLRTPTAPATTGAKADAAAPPPQPPAPPARTISASVGGNPAQLPH